MSFRTFTRERRAALVAARLNCESDACRPFEDLIRHFVPNVGVEPSLHVLAVRDPDEVWRVLVDGSTACAVRAFVRQREAHLDQPRAIVSMALQLIRPRRVRADSSLHDLGVHPVTVFMINQEGITAHQNMVITSEAHAKLWWFEPQQRREDTKDVPHATLKTEVLRHHFAQYTCCADVVDDVTLQDGDELCQCWCAWYAILRATSPDRASRELILQMHSVVKNGRGRRDGTHALRVFLHRVYHEVPFLLRPTRSGGTRATLADLVANNALPANDIQYAVPHAWCYRHDTS